MIQEPTLYSTLQRQIVNKALPSWTIRINIDCYFARPAAYELCKIDGSCILQFVNTSDSYIFFQALHTPFKQIFLIFCFVQMQNSKGNPTQLLSNTTKIESTYHILFSLAKNDIKMMRGSHCVDTLIVVRIEEFYQ